MGRIFIFILWGLLVYLLWQLFFPSKRGTPRDEMEVMVHDPNCNTFLPRSETIRKRVGGKVHYFCSRKCLNEYKLKVRSTPPSDQAGT
jgi:YHS domain-containing protein